MMLQLGDIALFQGQAWISKAIRVLTRTRGELETKANHVGIILVDGTERSAVVIEALNTVQLNVLYPKHERDLVAIARPINLCDKDRKFIGLNALKYLNRRYGYLKIVLHFLDRIIGGRYFFRRLGRIKRYPICSFLVADAFAAIGLDFGVPVGQAQPDDIWDFVKANPDKYKIIRDFRPL